MESIQNEAFSFEIFLWKKKRKEQNKQNKHNNYNNDTHTDTDNDKTFRFIVMTQKNSWFYVDME